MGTNRGTNSLFHIHYICVKKFITFVPCCGQSVDNDFEGVWGTLCATECKGLGDLWTMYPFIFKCLV